jgi:cytidine deaminase
MTELSKTDRERLVEAAASVRRRAHAPYSNFAVGAAVLDGDGGIHCGCNVENASYGLSVCAERNAVAAAVAAGAAKLVAVAVVTATSPPASPCGACRQVLAEFADMTVILSNPEGEYSVTSVAELLPRAFDPDVLNEFRKGKETS